MLKEENLPTRTEAFAAELSQKFLDPQADEPNRLSSRVFPRIEERQEKRQGLPFEMPERLSVIIERDAVLNAVRAIFGFKVGEAHREGYRAKTCELFFAELGDDPIGHTIEPLRNKGRASTVLLEGFLFSD